MAYFHYFSKGVSQSACNILNRGTSGAFQIGKSITMNSTMEEQLMQREEKMITFKKMQMQHKCQEGFSSCWMWQMVEEYL